MSTITENEIYLYVQQKDIIVTNFIFQRIIATNTVYVIFTWNFLAYPPNVCKFPLLVSNSSSRLDF